MLKRISSKLHNSLEHNSYNEDLEHKKMTHAEAAKLCTIAVETHKGDPHTTSIKCQQIREKYFNQYKSK